MTAESASPNSMGFDDCSVILLDVAGTTTSQEFVEELLSYADKQVESFIKSHWEEANVQSAVASFPKGDTEVVADTAIEIYKKLVENKENNVGVKTLQGLIYEEGYKKESLKAHVYPDVPKMLEKWSKTLKVAIFSSGSVESQKLLFKHSILGDLSPHISNYFDLAVGGKTESSSYLKIAQELNINIEGIAFITDSPEEAKAAKTAGASSFVITREPQAEIHDDSQKDIKHITSFEDITTKRKNEEENSTNEEPPSKIAKTEHEDIVAAEKSNQDEAMEVDANTRENVIEPIDNATGEEKGSTDAPNETNGDKTENVSEEKTEDVQETVVAVDVLDIEKTDLKSSDVKDEGEAVMAGAATEAVKTDASTAIVVIEEKDPCAEVTTEETAVTATDNNVVVEEETTAVSITDEKVSGIETITVTISEDKTDTIQVTNDQGNSVSIIETISETVLISNDKSENEEDKTDSAQAEPKEDVPAKGDENADQTNGDCKQGQESDVETIENGNGQAEEDNHPNGEAETIQNGREEPTVPEIKLKKLEDSDVSSAGIEV